MRHMINLRDTDKSHYFAINEFNNYFIIQPPILFHNYFNHFSTDQESHMPFFTRKCCFNNPSPQYCLQQNTFRHYLCMSIALSVDTYFQVTWWVPKQCKGRKNASNDKINSLFISSSYWEYGKYTTCIPNVVLYKFLNGCIFYHVLRSSRKCSYYYPHGKNQNFLGLGRKMGEGFNFL